MGIMKTWVLDLYCVSVGVKRQRCTDYKFIGHAPGHELLSATA